MGWQVIKQPNGKYCIFSSIVDNVVYYDGTKEQIINAFSKTEREQIEKRLATIFDKLDKGEDPYYQFTMSFNEMIDTIKDVHGEQEANKILKDLGNG